MTKKLLFLLVFSLLTSFAVAQKVSPKGSPKMLPIIKATSKKAYFMEGKEERHNWNISPEIPLDVHITTKIVKSKWITFYTNIDSIKVKLKPNEIFDFIVILNNKDTCRTRIKSLPYVDYSKQKIASHDTIPFVLTEFNNIKIKTILNKKDTLYLKFDSGTAGLLLTREVIKEKKFGEIVNRKDNILQFGNLTFDNLEIYPVELSGQGTVGRFGWDLFDGRIVEIDFDKNILIVHSKPIKISKEYSKFEMEHIYNSFCIQAELEIKGKKYKNRFLFDSGYQRTIMLDTLLMHKQNYPKDLKIIKKVMMKGDKGKKYLLLR